MSEPLLKTKDVAELLGVDMSTVIDYHRRGLLPGFRLGGQHGAPLRFWPSEVKATLEEWRRIDDDEGDNRNAPAALKRSGADTGKEASDAPRILRPVADA